MAAALAAALAPAVAAASPSGGPLPASAVSVVRTVSAWGLGSVSFELGLIASYLPAGFSLGSPALTLITSALPSTPSPSPSGATGNSTCPASSPAPPAPLSLDNITAALTLTLAAVPTLSPAASTPLAGSFRLSTLSSGGVPSGLYVDLPVSANASAVSAAVQQLTGLYKFMTHD